MVGSSPTKNAFTYYVEEYMAEEIARGRRITKKTALDECATGWKELDPEERLRYCNMANPMLNRTQKSGKKTPTPPNMEWLDPITGEYGEKWFRYVRSGDELNYLNNSLTDEKDLKLLNFYFVHFNYFCQTGLKRYIPAELALLKFNLADGIKKVYHTFINAGPIPLGYAYEAKKRSEDGHGIPVPPQSMGEKDVGKIIDNIKKFLKSGTDAKGKFPPLFTLEDNVLPAMHMLNDMVPYNEDEPVFIVYPSHRMFYWVKNKCMDISGKKDGFVDESFALSEIERDSFRYIVDIACDYHKQCETKFPMCSRSIVKRLAFTICNKCCSDLNIKLVRGKHVHKRMKESSLDQEDEEQRGKGNRRVKGEKEMGSGDETEEEFEFDRDLRNKNCNIPEHVPEFVGGYSTRRFPNKPLTGLSEADINRFYNALSYNALHDRLIIDLEEEQKQDELFLKLTKYDLVDDSPYVTGERGGPESSVAEQVEAYRYRENLKMKHAALARVKAREAREARRDYQRRMEEAGLFKIYVDESTSEDELDK